MSRVARKKVTLRLLGRAAALARDVVRECLRSKVLDAEGIWVFSLLARVGTATEAAGTLLAHGFIHDSQLVIRAAAEAMLDIYYVLHGPHRGQALHDLLEMELIEDEYEQVEFEAARRRKNLTHFLTQNPTARVIVDRYEKAKGQPRWSRRWRHITVEEKLRVLNARMPVWATLLDYPVRVLGNAVAHSRPIVMSHYVDMEHDGSCRVVAKPKPRGLYCSQAVAVTAFVSALMASDAIVGAFYLDDRFSRRVQQLANQSLWAVSRRRGANGPRARGAKRSH